MDRVAPTDPPSPGPVLRTVIVDDHELRRAGTVAELKKAADRHSDYLLGQHKEALRKEYVERLGIVKGHAK